MTRILITGVRGKTGAPLAQLLAAHDDVDVLGGSTDPSRVDADGVTPVAFSWDEPAGWAAAVDGIGAVYLVRPDRADAPELIEALLRELPAAARVVLLSERELGRFADDDWAPRIERIVREGGRPWTILRPSWFMQVFGDPRYYADAIADGRLPFADGGAHVAWIDARDIAAVAERTLLDDGHDGQAYELSGPESLTLAETAATLSVEHERLSVADAIAEVPDPFEREEMRWTLERLADGDFAEVTDTVERVTGRPARSLSDYASG